MSRPPQTLIDDLTTIFQWSRGAREVPYPEIDTVNAVVGDGITALTPGVALAIRVDFNAVITGCFLQEFDGNTGSIAIDIQRAQGGATPAWSSITSTTVPAIVTGRYFADETVAGWDTAISRGDYLRYVVTGATNIRRVHVALRIRRLEP